MTDRNILLVQSSARTDASTSRRLAAALADRLGGTVTLRDVAPGSDFVDGDWVSANFTPAPERSDAQRDRLSGSDALVAEIAAADTLIIGLPIYNFGMPATLKAWIDQIARAGVTFRYTENGPEGLMKGKKAYIVVASGGTEAFGEIDFATPHLRHVLGFIGITDVEVIRADRQMIRGEDAVLDAEAAISAIAA
nr:NAD(P)H-dependent oxidoreductase [Roseobacter sp. HKCCA0434]